MKILRQSGNRLQALSSITNAIHTLSHLFPKDAPLRIEDPLPSNDLHKASIVPNHACRGKILGRSLVQTNFKLRKAMPLVVTCY